MALRRFPYSINQHGRLEATLHQTVLSHLETELSSEEADLVHRFIKVLSESHELSQGPDNTGPFYIQYTYTPYLN